MKTIDLKEILKKHVVIEAGATNSYDIALNAMKDACEQTVDLCAENAEVIRLNEFSTHFEINEQSILKTKNQIV